MRETSTEPRVTMTVSCPLGLYQWLTDTQRNRSAFIVKAIEAARKNESESHAIPTAAG